ncbi:MAG: cytochrome family protein, partial [Acidobacteria bacterium]|nr:cytochrome family protein [Acidobacteriota bacterium]
MKLRIWGVVALLCLAAAAASAASLAITRASWGGEKLTVSGTAPGGSSVTIANAATGAVLGIARTEDSGSWNAVIEKPARVPCRVRATQGQASVERAVTGAPSNCDGGTTKSLTSLAITGPATVPESSTAT